MDNVNQVTTPQETVPNRRRYGFIVAFFSLSFLSAVFFYLDCAAIGVASIILSIVQIVLFLLAPRYYVFSKDSLTIKYNFSFKENIPWDSISLVTRDIEKPFKYTYLKSYEICYHSNKALTFFMKGVVSKNKKTAALFKKYYQKNINL